MCRYELLGKVLTAAKSGVVPAAVLQSLLSACLELLKRPEASSLTHVTPLIAQVKAVALQLQPGFLAAEFAWQRKHDQMQCWDLCWIAVPSEMLLSRVQPLCFLPIHIASEAVCKRENSAALRALQCHIV